MLIAAAQHIGLVLQIQPRRASRRTARQNTAEVALMAAKLSLNMARISSEGPR